MGEIRRRVTVRGRVQGVFYRDSVRRVAEARGVAGTAVNRDDGSVEVVLEGDREAVDELIAYCADGPERAEVSERLAARAESGGRHLSGAAYARRTAESREAAEALRALLTESASLKQDDGS